MNRCTIGDFQKCIISRSNHPVVQQYLRNSGICSIPNFVARAKIIMAVKFKGSALKFMACISHVMPKWDKAQCND